MNKLILILITLLISLSFTVFSQSAGVLEIKIAEIKIDSDDVILFLKIENIGDETITVYKPNIEDVCSSILKIKFIDTKTNKTHELFPCEQIIDLDQIILNSTNMIHLNPNEIFIKPIKFKLRDISPFIRKGYSYKVFLEFNLKNVDFVAECPNILMAKDNLRSNEVGVTIK